jgi:hypothetical protein
LGLEVAVALALGEVEVEVEVDADGVVLVVEDGELLHAAAKNPRQVMPSTAVNRLLFLLTGIPRR